MTRSLPALIAALATLAVAGCATKTVAPPPADTAPAANSPANAVKRLEWALNHHDVDMVDGMLTDDFVFISAGTDSAGNASRDTTAGRSWLGALLDPANQVSVKFDQNVIAFPDSRPGRNPTWHREIRTSTNVHVHDAQANTTSDVTGNALFFLTRGDSAAIPLELKNRGVKPDSTAWWFDRWEDETLASGSARGPAPPAATNPSIEPTLGDILQYYHSRSTK